MKKLLLILVATYQVEAYSQECSTIDNITRCGNARSMSWQWGINVWEKYKKPGDTAKPVSLMVGYNDVMTGFSGLSPVYRKFWGGAPLTGLSTQCLTRGPKIKIARTGVLSLLLNSEAPGFVNKDYFSIPNNIGGFRMKITSDQGVIYDSGNITDPAKVGTLGRSVRIYRNYTGVEVQICDLTLSSNPIGLNSMELVLSYE